MMNWQEIKEKYPKSINKLVKKYLNHNDNVLDLDIEYSNKRVDDGIFAFYNIRDLYDFFDEQGIIINVFTDRIQYKWRVIINNSYIKGTTGNTRQQAEEQAFIKAFEILEKK